MNAMGHDIPNMIGVSQSGIAEAFSTLVPDYMPMGKTGMSDMSDMADMMDMPLPENTLPMMMGKGQFGPVEMGGMFTTLKVREALAKHDYQDPGDYQHPKGTVAKQVHDDLPPVKADPNMTMPKGVVEMNVRKPMGNMKH
jgi:hypothetical protein